MIFFSYPMSSYLKFNSFDNFMNRALLANNFYVRVTITDQRFESKQLLYQSQEVYRL